MYKIQEAEMLANNIYRMVVEAPRVAQHCLPSLHYHTCAAAVGRVIHTVMLIFRIIADIAAVYLDAAILSRSADYAFAEHAEAHIGKES